MIEKDTDTDKITTEPKIEGDSLIKGDPLIIDITKNILEGKVSIDPMVFSQKERVTEDEIAENLVKQYLQEFYAEVLSKIEPVPDPDEIEGETETDEEKHVYDISIHDLDTPEKLFSFLVAPINTHIIDSEEEDSNIEMNNSNGYISFYYRECPPFMKKILKQLSYNPMESDDCIIWRGYGDLQLPKFPQIKYLPFVVTWSTWDIYETDITHHLEPICFQIDFIKIMTEVYKEKNNIGLQEN